MAWCHFDIWEPGVLCDSQKQSESDSLIYPSPPYRFSFWILRFHLDKWQVSSMDIGCQASKLSISTFHQTDNTACVSA